MKFVLKRGVNKDTVLKQIQLSLHFGMHWIHISAQYVFSWLSDFYFGEKIPKQKSLNHANRNKYPMHSKIETLISLTNCVKGQSWIGGKFECGCKLGHFIMSPGVYIEVTQQHLPHWIWAGDFIYIGILFCSRKEK